MRYSPPGSEDSVADATWSFSQSSFDLGSMAISTSKGCVSGTSEEPSDTRPLGSHSHPEGHRDRGESLFRGSDHGHPRLAARRPPRDDANASLRRDHHGHLAAFHARELLDLGDLVKVALDPHQHIHP